MIKKIAIGIVIAYASVVALFESLLGYYQPQSDGTLTITTTDAAGTEADRVLSSIRVKDRLYVAANHWPRAWYRQALMNPNVEVKLASADEFANFTAVPLEDSEDERVRERFRPGFRSQLRMGFAPREYLRLDPR